MEKETNINELIQLNISQNFNFESSFVNETDTNENLQFKIKEDIGILQPKKLSLCDINPKELSEKIHNTLSDKLEILESKFQNDLLIIEPYKFQFIDLYHDLENLKEEILEFLKKEEEKKNSKKKNNNKPINRNNTSRSRTPVKFLALDKLKSAKNIITSYINTKSNIDINMKNQDKSRSRTPLIFSKQNAIKFQKDTSVSKAGNKKILNITINNSSIADKNGLTTPRVNTTKKTHFEISLKKRDVTLISSRQNNKAIDTSIISHNESVNMESITSNTKDTNKKDKKGKIIKIIKIGSKDNDNKDKNLLNEKKRLSNFKEIVKKSKLGTNINEAQNVSNFQSNIDMSISKKKEYLGIDITNSSSNVSQTIQNCTSNNNINYETNPEINPGNKTLRLSIKNGLKFERKSSLPARRGSITGNNRNSIEIKKDYNNPSIDERIKYKEVNSKITIKRNSIEIKKFDENDNNKELAFYNTNENIKSKNLFKSEISNDFGKLINEKEIKIYNTSLDEEKTDEKRTSFGKIKIYQSVEIDKNKSLITERLSNNVISEQAVRNIDNDIVNMNDEYLINDSKALINFENTRNEDDFKKRNSSLQTEKSTKRKSIKKENFLLDYSNRKSCALHLVIKSG